MNSATQPINEAKQMVFLLFQKMACASGSFHICSYLLCEAPPAQMRQVAAYFPKTICACVCMYSCICVCVWLFVPALHSVTTSDISIYFLLAKPTKR